MALLFDEPVLALLWLNMYILYVHISRMHKNKFKLQQKYTLATVFIQQRLIASIYGK